MHRFVIGSRGSQLALWQANWVKGELEARGYSIEIEIIKTTGDKITDVPLAKVGTKGLFTKEIEEALLEGRVDLAVHSLKDLPTELPKGLTLGAIPRREDPRDALISAGGLGLKQLHQGAVIGTSSLRRSAQLLKARPDLKVEPLRGNLDTRLRRLDEGRFAAIVLAAAGLHRLGWQSRITEYLDPEMMCPAVAQGALGIEMRQGDEKTGFALAMLEDRKARAETTAERAFLARLGGGCQVPIGGYARIENGRVRLYGVVAAPDATRIFRGTAEGGDPDEVGARLAAQLLQEGADRVLAEVYGQQAALPDQP